MTTARTPVPEAARHLGLRERKKLKTRMAIRDATYALIKEQGYDATTVEQIADRAEVSPSTVFRYFPAKEDIVLTDEYDSLVEGLLRERPAHEPVRESLRWAIRKAMTMALTDNPDHGQEEMLLRVRLMVEVPQVRSRLMESMSVTGRLMCRALAERTGRHENDLEVRVYAMGLMGALLETMIYWVEGDCREDILELIDRTLDVCADLPRR
ncbi:MULTISPECIES: TetR/AcrR family transcriptional regulator [unclassified Streptomyces]|uniref:TetR/AcrR family transcriptional regulator n=1 Tax=unclassified Streptomyces TaxID=2593676 RepID=UPI000F6F949C|nr:MULTISPECIES: TetR family transcriptional regulator [unclassified Streptomyces]AZM60332.1 TetR family transcriptional regulator [Streptomyces sp. WAC 01438]RSM92432.1 TetR family transcriptional regulator [Streptomyces sp. WAC 01420]